MGRLRKWAGKDLVRLRGELREGVLCEPASRVDTKRASLAQTIGDNSSENGGISSKKNVGDKYPFA